jgi:hypothetical protein
MEPHATKVPAEKKLMKSDRPPIVQGTASPPAKNDLIFRPVLENNNPIQSIKAEKTKITIVSKDKLMSWNYRWFVIYSKHFLQT